jgi:hypothetical protein
VTHHSGCSAASHRDWQDLARLSPAAVALTIYILATPIPSVGPSISNVTFDIEDFNIVCSININVLRLRYCMAISKVFDIIEGLMVRYQRSPTFDIESH